MSKPLIFAGTRVPDPVRYLTYLFLRHPGRREGEVTRNVQLLDTYEYRFARAGTAILAGEIPAIVQPPVFMVNADTTDRLSLADSGWFEGWRLRAVWKGSARIIPLAFQAVDSPEIGSALIRFQGEWFLVFPDGLPESGRLGQTLTQDRWEPLRPLWFRSFLFDKTGSPFLSPEGPKRAKADDFGSEMIHLLSETLQKARLYEEGIKRNEESEPLHQYRVLIRKARALVALSRDYLPPEWAESMKAQLALLHRGTALLRDLDVQWAEWPELSAILESQGGLPAPVTATLERERRAEAKRVRKFLDSAEYQGIVNEVNALLQTVPVSTLSFAEAGEGIHKRGKKRLARKIVALLDHTEDRAIHEVRIAVKGLRYIQEFFSDGNEKDSFKELRDLKSLQEQLGVFQDNCVALERLHLMRTSGQLPSLAHTYPWGYLMGILEGKKAAAKNAILQCLRERI